FHVRQMRNDPAERVRRIGASEIEETVASWSGDGDAVTAAAHLFIYDPVRAVAIDGDESVDAVTIFPLLQQVMDSAQITQALLADIGHEQQRVPGVDIGSLDGFDEGQDGGQAA